VKIPIAFAVAALLLAGCAKKNDTPEAVRQGVIRDISKSFNVSNMDVSVDSVSFRDKEADATVTFSLKGGSKAQGMTMKYVMERRDDNQWYIKSRSSGQVAGAAGDAGASGAAALPAGHPGMGGAPMSGDAMGGADMAGASAGAAAGASGSKFKLPPGHPELGQ
jgi:hypothetical protein